jgi:hypothetical protein
MSSTVPQQLQRQDTLTDIKQEQAEIVISLDPERSMHC